PYARQYLAEQLSREDFPQTGLFVRAASGPSAAAGIKANDFLLEVDGQKIETTFDLNKVLLPKRVGDKVQVKFWTNGTTKTTTVTLAEIQPSL
ncbi:MAG TPA: PDZ domain-containing protein, partial [Fimbriimonas sp.]|nr:PDZ domain-containing protein [Fimbriimonas sp.]